MGIERAGSSIITPSRGPTTIGIGRIGPPNRGPSSFKISPEFSHSFSKTKSPTIVSKLNINAKPATKAGNSFFEKSIGLQRGKNAFSHRVEGYKNLLPQAPRIASERPFKGKLTELFALPHHQVIGGKKNNQFRLERNSLNTFDKPLVKFDRTTHRSNTEQPIIYQSLKLANDGASKNFNQNLGIREKSSARAINFSLEKPSVIFINQARIERLGTVTKRDRVREVIGDVSYKSGLKEVFYSKPSFEKFEFQQFSWPQSAENISVTQNKIKGPIEQSKSKPQNHLEKTINAFKTAGLEIPKVIVNSVIKSEIMANVLGVPGLDIGLETVAATLPKTPEKVVEFGSRVEAVANVVKINPEIQAAIKVLSNPAKVDPETTQAFREIAKAEIAHLGQNQLSERVSSSISIVESIKAKLFLILRRELVKKVETQKIEEEELIAEIDNEAMEARLITAEIALEKVIQGKLGEDQEMISIQEVGSKIPTSIFSQEKQTSEPLRHYLNQRELHIPDGSLRETWQDIASDKDKLTVTQAWERIKSYIFRKPAVRFRKVVTTREASNADVDRVFRGRSDIRSLIYNTENLGIVA